MASILHHGKPGYSRHPETVRWRDFKGDLAQRHCLLVAEMRLRGYRHASPLPMRPRETVWPSVFVTAPADQFDLLKMKYVGREGGRIRLPGSTQVPWAQHKYSVMARNPELYRSLGRVVSGMTRMTGFRELALQLVEIPRQPPSVRRIVNALEHMWGHVCEQAFAQERRAANISPNALLRKTQSLATRVREPFVYASTALREFAVYLDDTQ